MTTTNTTGQKCTVQAWCSLRADHFGICRQVRKADLEVRHPALSEVLIWMPEWLVAAVFLFGSLVASGLLSLGCLLISLAAVVWIVANRAIARRRNDKVLRAYEQNQQLVAADAQLLENGTDR